MPTDPAPPWERQPGEPARAFAAFAVYRDCGGRRSLAEACRRFYGDGGSTAKVRCLERWSATWRWVERAGAWDAELDRQSRRKLVEAVEAMHQRHAQEAVEFQTKALDRLRKLSVDDLTPAQVLAFFIEAVKVERTARGEPEAVIEQKGDVPGHVSFFARVAHYADALRRIGESRVPGGTLPGIGGGEPLAPPAADRPPK